MTYADSVTVYRLADAPAAGDPGAPDSDTGWAPPEKPGAQPTENTLYDGPADVQDGQRTLTRLAEQGESETANAVVYLPPPAATAFAGFQTGDLVTTPLGSGEVVSIRHTDAALVVALTRSTPAPPVIL